MRRLVGGHRGIRLGAFGGLQGIRQESRESDGIGNHRDLADTLAHNRRVLKRNHTMWKPWSAYFFAASPPTQ